MWDVNDKCVKEEWKEIDFAVTLLSEDKPHEKLPISIISGSQCRKWEQKGEVIYFLMYMMKENRCGSDWDCVGFSLMEIVFFSILHCLIFTRGDAILKLQNKSADCFDVVTVIRKCDR